jgi:CBS domain-containing protein
MRVRDIMIPVVGSVDVRATLRDATETMKSLDIDPLPVCDAGRLVGLLSWKAVQERAVQDLLSTGTVLVSEVMDRDAACCLEDQDVVSALREAEDTGRARTAHRLPVTNGKGILVGIVSLQDLRARSHSDGDGVSAMTGVEAVDQLVDYQDDPVEYGSDASFPASDPPAPPRDPE